MTPKKDPAVQREFQNVYQSIKNPIIQNATISSATVNFMAVSTMTVSSATVVNLSVTNLNGSTFLASKFVQMTSGNSTSNFATTNAAFQTTNLTASITPKSSANSIFILATGSFDMATQGVECRLTLARNGTNILAAAGQAIGFTQTGGEIESPVTLSWLDSPATTSSVTYAVQVHTDGTHTCTFGLGQQFIFLAEVAP